jgi:hypothetical protein
MDVVSLLKALASGETASHAVSIPGWASLNQRKKRKHYEYLLDELEWK